MKSFFFSVLSVICLAVVSHSYDRIDFKKQISALSFMSPAGVAASSERVYVTDSKANSLFVFERGGKLLDKIGMKGSGAKNFKNPQAVAFGNGKVYIADTGNSRIQVTDADGKFLSSFGAGQLDRPEGVAVASDGRIYVADTGNSRIRIYTPDGIFLHGFDGSESGKAGMNKPIRIAVDLSDNVYVLDSGGERIMKFNPGGRLTKDFQARGNSLCVDRYGFIYTVDQKHGKVRELAPDGNSMTFGSRGTGPGQFSKPTGICVSPSGSLLVSDGKNRRVLEFRLENKEKTTELPANTQTKINIHGPLKVYKHKIGGFAMLGDSSLFGYLMDSRELALINAEGKLVRKFGARGKKPGQTSRPGGFVFSEKYGLLVSDTGNNRIQVFTSTGGFVRIFGQKSGLFGSRSKEGKMNKPAGIALIKDKDTLYVADTGNSRVQAFNTEGIFMFSIGPEIGGYTMKEPVSVQWDPAGFLYILDRGLKKVFKVKPSGKYVSDWGDIGPGMRQWQDPAAMVYDGHSYIYILDRETAQLKLYDTSGNWVESFFAKGAGEKDLADPVFLGFLNNSIVISDPGNSKVTSFEIRPKLAPPSGILASEDEGKVKLVWKSADKAWVGKYLIYRSDLSTGPYVKIASVDSMPFSDAPSQTHATYYYRIAVQAKTGDTGFQSKEARVFVPSSVNVAPIELDKIDLGYIFSANYKYYLKNPIGKLLISNNTDATFSNVKLSFSLKDFMDFPYDTVIEKISPREKTEVLLMATLNNRILDVSEDTPIQAQFRVTYYYKGEEKTITLNKPVKVLSRNAIVWDRAERMANFITPKDPPVFAFGRSALLMKPKADDAIINRNLSTALILWSAAGELGMSYLQDPSNPYKEIKSAQALPLDTVQMARDTLKLKSGECDDLVAFFTTLFEGAGLHTALLDYPGHIAFMFDTGLAEALEVGLPGDRLVKYQNSWWIPVEATMVGKSLRKSVRQAFNTYKNSSKEVRIIDTHQAWSEFEPVTLPKTTWESPAPDKDKTVKKFREDAKSFSKSRYDFLKSHFEKKIAKDQDDADAIISIGILQAQYGNSGPARKQFDRVLAKDPLNPSALNNIGNIYLEEKDYARAQKFYLKASQADQYDPGIWMNRARAALKLDKKKEARTFAEKAVGLDKTLSDIADALLQ